ncbi:protein BTG2 [Polymixia lowei]
MRTELLTAVNFITSLLRSNTRSPLSEDPLHHLNCTLQEALREHYQHHWFPSAPCRGSGYRCIRINHKMDPVIGRAAGAVGLTGRQIYSLLPRQFTMWVDPSEVSYRIGENGSIGVLYDAKNPANQEDNLVDVETTVDEPTDCDFVSCLMVSGGLATVLDAGGFSSLEVHMFRTGSAPIFSVLI